MAFSYSSSSSICEQATQNVTNEKENKDAGALFVLESKGTWLHAGYHLTSSTAAPALLSLPYVLAGLGWIPGLLLLAGIGLLSFYAYWLLSSVMERMEKDGERILRFRDLSTRIMGSTWSSLIVTPIQFVVCFVTVVSLFLIGGQGLKALYEAFDSNGNVKLYDFIIVFGILGLISSQMPSFHSLRHINLVSIFMCIGYSCCAVVGAIIAAKSKDHQTPSYKVVGSSVQKLFTIFTAISIIATSFGNAVITEIQATLAPPVEGKMLKGLLLCYVVIFATYFSVAISGYWAFGNASGGVILSNMAPTIPKWLYFSANLFIVLQVLAVALIYMQPTFEALEGKTSDARKTRCSARNVLPRLITRSLFVCLATLLAAALPFFGEINALIGAIGYTPLDFVLPMVFHLIVFKPTPKTLLFWVNILTIPTFLGVTVMGAVASVRQIAIEAKTYKLFANL